MMGCFQGHFLTQSSNTILIQTTQTISQFILVSTYVYFTTQNGPKRQNNKSQFIFLKVECWVLKITTVLSFILIVIFCFHEIFF